MIDETHLDIFQPTGPLYSGSFFLEPRIDYSSRATHLLLGKIIQLSIICWARTYFIRQYDRGWVFIASKMWSMCLRTLIVEYINTNMAELILKMNSQVASCLPVSFLHLSFFSFFHLKTLFNQHSHALMIYHNLVNEAYIY